MPAGVVACGEAPRDDAEGEHAPAPAPAADPTPIPAALRRASPTIPLPSSRVRASTGAVA